MIPQGKNGIAAPSLMVVFGASGDLFRRLLLPALFNLKLQNKLPDEFTLLGFAREDWQDDHFRQHIADSLNQFWGEGAPQPDVSWLQQRAFYQPGDFAKPEAFQALQSRIEALEKARQTTGNRLFYLAVAPSFISPLVKNLSELKLCCEVDDSWRRIIVEKPFGSDLESARQLNAELLREVKEPQIYRIDHFAGKGAVQDLSIFRFGNTMFEPFWNRTYIDNIQITAAETVGLEGRAGFYEKSGALRDMVPNHLAKILSIIAMEPPVSFNAEHTRAKQSEILQAIRAIAPEDADQWAVRGQYGEGVTSKGPQPAYRQEKDVPPGSFVETYAASAS